LRYAYLLLLLALLGLPFAGLGAILFSPLVAASAFGLSLMTPSPRNRIISMVLIVLSGSLWLCGLLLGVILIVHVI
jgi:hypothetical protein